MTQPSLSGAAVNLSALREHGQNELIDVLDSIRGKKALVLDPQFTGPLGLIAGVSMLKEHGVERIYHLSDAALQAESKNVLYLVRPKVKYMKQIAKHVQTARDTKQNKNFSLYFVPRRTMICERVLEDEGVHEDITIGEYQLDLIPLEDDVLTLALDSAYKECFLEGDRTALFYLARSLIKLQSMFGIFPEIKGKGSAAKLVCDMLVRMRKETAADEAALTPEFDNLIIIDREVDMVTPLCTQLTYGGLIDELYGINNGIVQLDAALVQGDKAKKDGAAATSLSKSKVPLNGGDALYAEVRDVNFATLGPLLNQRAKRIDEYYKRRSNIEDLSALQEFMKGLGGYQAEHKSLVMHTAIAGQISKTTNSATFRKNLEWEQAYLAGESTDLSFIEECINRHDPIVKVLRLLCLFSLTCNGLKAKQFDFFRREILQTYGYEYLFTLHNLEKLGLLKKSESRGAPWSVLRRTLQLIVDDLDETRPNDVAYVFSGYAPLSVRLIEAALSAQGWHGLDDALKLLPGPTFETRQALPAGVADTRGKATGLTMVVFIGGVTQAELSALRFLSVLENNQREFVIVTTKMVNGASLLESFIEKT